MKKLSPRVWLTLVLVGLVGQFAWTIENMYFNVYLYNTISTDPGYISAMVGWSAAAATLTTLFNHFLQLLSTFRSYQLTGKDIRNSNSQCDAKNDKRSTDTVVHSCCYLTYYPVHIDECEKSTIHQYSRNHRDYTRNRKAMVRSMEPVNSLYRYQTDKRRTGERTNNRSPV